MLPAHGIVAESAIHDSRPDPSTASARSFPARLVLVGASIALSLLVCEAALRGYVARDQGFGTLEQFRAYEQGERIPTRSSHPLVLITRLSTNRKLVYELLPNVDKIFGGRRIRTNADGLREDREYDRVPPASTRRIVGVGDSGMWGWAVHQGEDYLSVLEENLGRRGGPLRYEVLNLAVPGYNTQQEVEMLRSKGLAYSPDIVILGWCGNDYTLPLFLYRKKNHFELKGGSYLLNLVFRPRRFRERLQPEVLKLGEIDRSLVDPVLLEGKGPEGVLLQLRSLARLGEKHRFRAIVVGSLDDRVVRMCRELGLTVFNLRTEVDPKKLPSGAKVHGCHPNALGHRILAEHLERFLEREGWLTVAEGARLELH